MQLRKENGIILSDEDDIISRSRSRSRSRKAVDEEELVEQERARAGAEELEAVVRKGVTFYASLQAEDGHWPAESAGPLFFLPPLVRACTTYQLYIYSPLIN